MNQLQQFIQDHFDDPDWNRLLLSAHRYPGVDIPLALRQMHALKKLREKAPTWADPALHFPDALSIEQASSQRTAVYKAGLFAGGRMVDLTGGLGIDAWAFSRSFEQVDYVEQDAQRASDAAFNFGQLGAPNIAVHHTEAAIFLKNTALDFDLIYIDPARRNEAAGRVFRLEDCMPNVLDLKALLLEKSPKVLLKAAPMLDLRAARVQLEQVTAVWVVSVRGEVREVLYLLERLPVLESVVPICAVCLNRPDREFCFTDTEEKEAKVVYGMPEAFLYDPDAALLKAGAFKCLSARYGLRKLHPFTHLYTRQTPVEAFPGRRFRVLDVVKYDKKTVQAAVGEGRANVAVRQFPETAEQVRRKLGLKDGGEVYLFATTLAGAEKRVLICEKDY